MDLALVYGRTNFPTGVDSTEAEDGKMLTVRVCKSDGQEAGPGYSTSASAMFVSGHFKCRYVE